MDASNRKILSTFLVMVLALLGCSSEPPSRIKTEFRNDAFAWYMYVRFKIQDSSRSLFEGNIGPNGEVSEFLYCMARNEEDLVTLPDDAKASMLSNSWGCRYRMFFFDQNEYLIFIVRCRWPDEETEKTMQDITVDDLDTGDFFHKSDYSLKKRDAPDSSIIGLLDKDGKFGPKD